MRHGAWRSVSGRTLAVLLLLAVSPVFPAPVVMTDDYGRRLRLEAPAERIVALAPNITELAFAAGAGTRLVGVTRFSDYPPAAKDIPVVGDSSQVDLERLVSLRPDLVLAWKTGTRRADADRIAALGIPVFALEPARLSDIARVVRAIGELAGTSTSAQQAAARFEADLERLRRGYGSRQRLPVFYMIWDEPLMTVNRRHMISDVLELCGGENVFAHAPGITPQISLESLIAANPRVVISSVHSRRDDPAAALAPVKTLRAVAQKQVYYVEPDHITRQTPRILEGAEAVCRALEQARRVNGE